LLLDMFVNGGPAWPGRGLTCRDHRAHARASCPPLSKLKDGFNKLLELMCPAIKAYAQRSCMITAGSRKLTILTTDGMERGEVGLGLWRSESLDNVNYAYIP